MAGPVPRWQVSTDPFVEGSPPSIGRAVAAHWRHYWDELVDGGEPRTEAMAVMPSPGGAGVAVDGNSAESLVAVVFSRGLDPAKLDKSRITVTTAGGESIDVKYDVIYGTNGHALRMRPKTAWPADNEVWVSISGGAVTSADGLMQQRGLSFEFSTGAPNDVAPGGPPAAWSLAPIDASSPPLGQENTHEGCAASPVGGTHKETLALLLAIAALLAIARRRPGSDRLHPLVGYDNIRG